MVGAFGISNLSQESALAYDGVFLYAADDDGDYLRINPSTGAATLLTSTGEDLEGLAIAPVPEPSTFLLFAAGLAGLGLWRLKRWKQH